MSRRRWDEAAELVDELADKGTPFSRETYLELFANFKRKERKDALLGFLQQFKAYPHDVQ
jgi:hypothetical protein